MRHSLPSAVPSGLAPAAPGLLRPSSQTPAASDPRRPAGTSHVGVLVRGTREVAVQGSDRDCAPLLQGSSAASQRRTCIAPCTSGSANYATCNLCRDHGPAAARAASEPVRSSSAACCPAAPPACWRCAATASSSRGLLPRPGGRLGREQR
jgi:hypothetical protein